MKCDKMLFKFFEVKIDITFPVVNKLVEFVKQYELTTAKQTKRKLQHF